MDKDEQIRKGLKHFTKTPEVIFVATVVAVNKTDDTIEIIDLDELEYEDVRLKSVINSKDDVVSYPAIKSTVLVSKIGNDENTLFVVACSEVESIKGTIKTTDFEIDKDGYKISRQDESLKTVLNDFIDEVNKIVVVQGNTINIGAVNAIKARLNKILK